MRRLPWVTFALMGACFVALLATNGRVQRAEAEAAAAQAEVAAALEAWAQRPYLRLPPRALDGLPRALREELAPLAAAAVSPPAEASRFDLLAEQTALDARLAPALERLARAKAAHPYLAHGFRPERMTAWGLFAHMFMHAGWLHLLGNLFMLFVAGPALEDRWGRPLFAAVYGLSGAGGALVFAAFAQDPSIPLVGASGAISGVFGAFLVRFWSTQIRFWYFLWVVRIHQGTFEQPAYVMLPLWLANELLQAWLTHSLGVSSGVANTAHIGGFLMGAAAALCVKASRLDERFDREIDEKLTVRGNEAVAEALALREQGDLAGAIRKLALQVKQAPRDGDAVDAYWDACAAAGCPGDAAHAVLALAQRELAANDGARAAQRFVEVRAALPDYGFDAAFVARLVPHLREMDRELARRALEWLALPRTGALAPTLAQRAVEQARALDPLVAKRLARKLAASELPDAMRARFAALAAALEAEAPEPPARGEGIAPAPPAPPEDDWDALQVLDAGDLAAPPPAPRFAALKASEATPLALSDGALTLALDGGRRAQLALASVDGIALAAVRGLAAKPVLVVDLLLGWRSLEGGELRCVRLRSDRFDPRRLAPAPDPLAALRAFVARLVAASGATPLHAADPARAGALEPFADAARYEREVLEVAA